MNQSTENIFDLSMVTENLIPFEDSYPSIFDAHFNHSWHPFHSLSFPALKTAPTHLPEPRFSSARQEGVGRRSLETRSFIFSPTDQPLPSLQDPEIFSLEIKRKHLFSMILPTQVYVHLGNRKQHPKGASLLDLTFHFNMSVMCFQDLFRDG